MWIIKETSLCPLLKEGEIAASQKECESTVFQREGEMK